MKRFLLILCLLPLFAPLRAATPETEAVRRECAAKLLQVYAEKMMDNCYVFDKCVFVPATTYQATPYYTLSYTGTLTNSSNVTLSARELEKKRPAIKKAAVKWISSHPSLQMLIHDLWPTPGISLQAVSADGETFTLDIPESEYGSGPWDPATKMKNWVKWWRDYAFLSTVKDQISPYRLVKYGLTHDYEWIANERTLRYCPIIYEKVDFGSLSEEALQKVYFGMVRSAWQLLYEKGKFTQRQGLPVLLAAYQGGSLSTEVTLESNGKTKGRKLMKTTVSNEDFLKMLGDGACFKRYFPLYAEYDPEFDKVLALTPVPLDDKTRQKIDAYCNKVFLGIPGGLPTDGIRELVNLKKDYATVPPLPGTMNAFVKLVKNSDDVEVTLTTAWYKIIDNDLPTGNDIEGNLAIRPGKPSGCIAIGAACALKRKGNLRVTLGANRLLTGDQTITVTYADLVDICSKL